MRLAEEVTFGGAGLDRAAALRGKPDEIAALLARGRVLPLWRGRVLMAEAGHLGWVTAGAAVLESTAAPAFPPLAFLGLDGETPCFAADLSAWTPPEGTAAPTGFFDSGRQGHPALPADLAFEDLRGRMADLSPREAELAVTARALLQWHASHGFCAACGAATDMVQAGWQRSCPACAAQHFPRTDPVAIMLVTRGNRLLLGRNAAWPEGMYSLLAGFMEPGETLEAAVRREVVEETGVRVGPVRYLASQPWPFPASLMLGAHAEAESDAITLDPVELEDALWVSREELAEAFAGRHPRIKPSRKGAIASFLMRNWLADRLD